MNSSTSTIKYGQTFFTQSPRDEHFKEVEHFKIAFDYD